MDVKDFLPGDFAVCQVKVDPLTAQPTFVQGICQVLGDPEEMPTHRRVQFGQV